MLVLTLMSPPYADQEKPSGASGAGGASPKMSAICLGDRIVSVGTVTVLGFDVVVGRFRRRRETSGRSWCIVFTVIESSFSSRQRTVRRTIL